MATNVSKYTIEVESNAKKAAADAAALNSEYRAAAEAVKQADAAFREAAKAAREADKAGKPAARARVDEAREQVRAAKEQAREKGAAAKEAAANAKQAANAEKREAASAARSQAREAAASARNAARAESREKAKATADAARAAKQAASAQDKLGASLRGGFRKEEGRRAKELADGVKDIGKAGGKAAQGAKGLEASIAGLRGAIGSARGSAIGLAIALAVTLVAGAVAAYTALVQFAFAAASAVRETRLLAGALTGNARLADEFVAVVDQLAAEVPLAKDQIRDLAREMSLLRLGRRDMQAGMASIAIVSSAIGDAAGNAVKAIVQQSAAIKKFTLGARNMYGEYAALTGTGLKERDVLAALAAQMKTSIPEVEKALLLGRVKMADGLKALEAAARAKFGKTVAAQMLAFDVQVRKAKENLAGMFAGVDIEPALRGLQDFLEILDPTTESGKTMQMVLTTGINAVSKALETVGPIAKKFFQGMEIAALNVFIAVYPIAKEIGKMVSSLDSAGAKFSALTAGKAVLYSIVAVLGLIGAAALLAMAPILIMAGAFALIGIAVYEAYSKVKTWIVSIIAAVMSARDAIKGMSWGDVATALIDGLVNGIKSGASRVAQAARDLATAAKDAVKGALGIASPSKVFAQLGQFTAEGFTVGVDKGAPAAQAATEQMVQPPTPAGGGAPAAPSAIGGLTVIIQNLTVSTGEGWTEVQAKLTEAIRAARLGGAAEAGT